MTQLICLVKLCLLAQIRKSHIKAGVDPQTFILIYMFTLGVEVYNSGNLNQ